MFKADVEYPKELQELRSNLLFLPERMKTNKCEKLVCNLYNKKKLCNTNKSFEAAIESWTDTRKSSRGNQV